MCLELSYGENLHVSLDKQVIVVAQIVATTERGEVNTVDGHLELVGLDQDEQVEVLAALDRTRAVAFLAAPGATAFVVLAHVRGTVEPTWVKVKCNVVGVRARAVLNVDGEFLCRQWDLARDLDESTGHQVVGHWDRERRRRVHDLIRARVRSLNETNYNNYKSLIEFAALGFSVSYA